MLSDLGRLEAHCAGCCTAPGAGSALAKLASRPGFKHCGLHLMFFLPSYFACVPGCLCVSLCHPWQSPAGEEGMGPLGMALLRGAGQLMASVAESPPFAHLSCG